MRRARCRGSGHTWSHVLLTAPCEACARGTLGLTEVKPRAVTTSWAAVGHLSAGLLTHRVTGPALNPWSPLWGCYIPELVRGWQRVTGRLQGNRKLAPGFPFLSRFFRSLRLYCSQLMTLTQQVGPVDPDSLSWCKVVLCKLKTQTKPTSETYWAWKSKTLQSAVFSLSTLGFFS